MYGARAQGPESPSDQARSAARGEKSTDARRNVCAGTDGRCGAEGCDPSNQGRDVAPGCPKAKDHRPLTEALAPFQCTEHRAQSTNSLGLHLEAWSRSRYQTTPSHLQRKPRRRGEPTSTIPTSAPIRRVPSLSHGLAPGILTPGDVDACQPYPCRHLRLSYISPTIARLPKPTRGTQLLAHRETPASASLRSIDIVAGESHPLRLSRASSDHIRSACTANVRPPRPR